MKIEDLKTDTKGLIKLLAFLESEENTHKIEVEHGTNKDHVFYLDSVEPITLNTGNGIQLGEYKISINERLKVLKPTYRNRLYDLLKEVCK